jgi:syntaxin 16
MGGLPSPTGGSSTPVQNPFTDPSMMESETDRSFSQSTLQQTKQKRIYNDNDSVIAQREKEIEDIAQGIIELANIFQELQTMVIDQGSMLDRIDFNVESMAIDVKEADKELTVATGYQRRTLKRKIMLLLIIIIAGMFILLGLKLSSKSTPAPPAPPRNPDPVPEGQSASSKWRRSDTSLVWSKAIEPPFILKKDWRRRRRRDALRPARYITHR